jgi:hypothetical protein
MGKLDALDKAKTDDNVRAIHISKDIEALKRQKNEMQKRVEITQKELDEREILIEFMDSLRDYVLESHCNIAHDERESSEFVDIFLKTRRTA